MQSINIGHKFCLLFFFAAFLMIGIVPAEAQQNNNRNNYFFNSYLNQIGYSEGFHLGAYLDAHTFIETFEGEAEDLAYNLNHFGLLGQLNVSQSLKIYADLNTDGNFDQININNLFADIKLNRSMGLRFGIQSVPIGHYNQYHITADRHFINRPLLNTLVLPVNYADESIFLYGKAKTKTDLIFNYQLGVVMGLNENILYTPSANTEMQLGKENEFLRDNNNLPMYSLRIALEEEKVFRTGISFLGGVYNQIEEDVINPDTLRNIYMTAVDAGLHIGKLEINAEAALNLIELPGSMQELYADQQQGLFVDLSYPLIENFNKQNGSGLYLSGRYGYVDMNVGYFDKTDEEITNEYHRLSTSLNLRIRKETNLMLNYYYQWFSDLLGNPYKKTSYAGVGVATYF